MKNIKSHNKVFGTFFLSIPLLAVVYIMGTGFNSYNQNGFILSDKKNDLERQQILQLIAKNNILSPETKKIEEAIDAVQVARSMQSDENLLALLQGDISKTEKNLRKIFTENKKKGPVYFEKAGSALRNIGALYFFQDPEKSIELYRESLEYDPKSFEGLAYYGRLLQRTGMFPEALKVFEQLANLKQTSENIIWISFGLRHIGAIYRTLGRTKEAVDHLTRALNFSIKHNLIRDQGATLVRLATVQRVLGNYEMATNYSKQAIEINFKINDILSTGYSYNEIGNVHFVQDEYNLALENYTKALTIYERFKEDSSIASTRSNLGLIYMETGQYDLATWYYQKALETNEKLNMNYNKLIVMSNLATLSRLQKKFEEALKGFNQVIVLAREYESSELLVEALNSIAILYYEDLNDLDMGEKYLKEALALNQMSGYREGQADQYNNLGDIYLLRGDNEAALNYYRRALSINIILQRKSSLAINRFNLGDVYFRMGDAETSCEYLLSAHKEALEIPSLWVNEDVVPLLEKANCSSS